MRTVGPKAPPLPAVVVLAAWLLAIAVPAAVVAPAFATEGPPVAVRLLGEPRYAKAGEPFTGTLEIVSQAKARVSGFRLEGEGWQTVALEAPAEQAVEKSDRLEVHFAALPRDPEQPLTFRFEYGGRTVSQNLDLSERHFRLMTQGGETRPLPAGAKLLPQKSPAKAAQGRPADFVREVPAGAQSYNVTVTGGWYYSLPDSFNYGWIGTDEMLVEVYDEEMVIPQLLASTYTNAVGRFSVTFPWDGLFDQYPDIYVRFVARSGHIDVRDHTYESRYYWQTGTWHNYAGTSLEVGGLTTPVESQMPIMHQLAGLTHVWRWHNDYGYDCGFESVFYPADGEYHNGEGIHIPSNPDVPDVIDGAWHEGGYSHEYGHHWQSVFAPQPPFDYFNGVCDGDPPTPPGGHCYWCWELGSIVVLEGFPGVLGDIVPRDLQLDYGLPIVGVDTSEMIWPCYDHWDDPNTTEGFYGALLRDIWDSAQDSHGHFGTWQDRIAEGPGEILAVTHLDNPQSPLAFLGALRARYPGINTENLWETAMNCGYDFDAAAPGVVTGLHSTSHTVNVSSPDQTIDLSWTTASDDASGIAGYGIFVTHSASLPSATMDIGDVTHTTTSALAPGTWYFNIRAVDRAGRWSSSYVSAGPYIIREAQPSDLQPHVSFGWTRPLVPREDDAAMGTDVPEPVTLTGNAADTYWNLNGLNDGESATGAFRASVYVDGAYLDYRSWSNINAGGNYMVTNDGPHTVRGGRHTFEVFHDALEQVAETDETDNRWAHQWVWTPLLLTTNSLTTRSAPPGYQAGWDAIVDGSTKYYNCDGLSFSGAFYAGGLGASWDAIYLYAVDNDEDYDCRMHVHTTGASDGFAGANLGWSARSAGYLDAVLNNANTAGIATRDVGVLNDSGGAGSYRAMRLRAGSLALDDSVTAALAQYEMMVLRRFQVAIEDTGWYTITVSVDPPAQPFQVQYYLPTFETGTISSYDARAASTTGRTHLNRHLTQTGWHGLMVYRNPRDGTDACTFTIEMSRTPPDFTSAVVSGWHAPFVPRPLPDGTSTLVALPDTLHGDANATYFNYCQKNDSPAAWSWDGTHTAIASIIIDGATNLGGIGYTSWSANQVRTYNQTSARTVRAGRHVATMVQDLPGYIPELSEANNAYGEQYCWSPCLLAFATPAVRAAPPDKTGGWSDVLSGETRYYNCDGLRLPAGGVESWRAVAVMPAAANDVDVRLHHRLVGTKSGFTSSLAASAWGPGQSDFVLVCAHDFFVLPPMTVPMDAGVMLGAGAADYTAEAALATALTPDGSDTYGPFTLGTNSLVHLYSLYLTPDTWALRLDNLAGSVDWGLSIYEPNYPFKNKSGAMAGGLAYLNERGQEECLTVDVASAGWYCVAVWKVGAADLAASGTYQLRIHSGVTEAPDGPPPARPTALVAVRPNPFNPQTRIVYDLGAAGPVRLEVYDLRGVRVRTLVAAEQTAGRHEAAWNGRDDAGQEVASGVYMARLAAGDVRQMRKLTLLK